MKKIFCLLLFLFLAASLNAQPQSDIDASKLINLVNTVGTLSSEYAKKYDNYRNVLKAGADKYEQLREHYNPDSPVNFKGAGFFPVNAGFLDAYREALEAVSAMMKEKSAIESAVETARKKTAGLERWGKSLRQYFVDKSFVSDNFAGYLTAKDSLEYYLVMPLIS